jgi:hypothetical protein
LQHARGDAGTMIHFAEELEREAAALDEKTTVAVESQG